MTKHEAITIFGGARKTADALKISRQAVYAWPAILSARTRGKVISAAKEQGKNLCYGNRPTIFME